MMKKSLKSPSVIPAAVPAVSGVPDAAGSEGTSRRAFLQGTAGAAAGAAVILATPKVVSAIDAAAPGAGAQPKAVVTTPSGPTPREPVTAYVHNAELHEVTVLSGTQETTYKDPALVKRLLDAAR
jgi:anaerobic selenocysteine-containing dehydrogenase